MTTRFVNARVVLQDDVVETDVTIADGLIISVGEGSRAERTVDAGGALLAPALVDIHGDAFERQVMPRPGVHFPMDAALLDTDRQLAANGIATAYHAVTLSWEPGLRSVEQGRIMIEALTRLRDRLTIDNRLQLRWETFAFEAIDLMETALDDPIVPAVAFNDHTSMSMSPPGQPPQERLFEQNPGFAVADVDDPRFVARFGKTAARAGLSADEYADLLLSVWDRRPDVPAAIDRIATKAGNRGAPMLSHDDSQDETRAHYRARGVTISEFPMRVPVAEAAKAAGDSIVFGAPNVVRGGSHIGSPNAAEMVESGLCDVLASDYFYPSMLAAVARLVEEKRASLPDIWHLVSGGAAKACGLDDRGVIQAGKRADLVLVDWPHGETPAVTMTLVGGRVAYRAGPL